jgi:hypothetical protein
LAGGRIRWRVVYDAKPDPVTRRRRQITRTFDKEADAKSFLAEQTAAKRTDRDERRHGRHSPQTAALWADILEDAAGGFDPASVGGCHVYLLWARKGDEVPLYVGSSANVLYRLGQHLANSAKKAQVGWVSLIRCDSPPEMIARERALIRYHMPPWNEAIPSERVVAAGPPWRSLRYQGLDARRGAARDRDRFPPSRLAQCHERRSPRPRTGVDRRQRSSRRRPGRRKQLDPRGLPHRRRG